MSEKTETTKAVASAAKSIGNNLEGIVQNVSVIPTSIVSDITKRKMQEEKDSFFLNMAEIKSKSEAVMAFASIPKDIVDSTFQVMNTSISAVSAMSASMLGVAGITVEVAGQIGAETIKAGAELIGKTLEFAGTAVTAAASVTSDFIKETSAVIQTRINADVDIAKINAEVEKVRITEKSEVLKQMIAASNERFSKQLEYLELKEKCVSEIKLKICDVMNGRMASFEDMYRNAASSSEKAEVKKLIRETQGKFSSLLTDLDTQTTVLGNEKSILNFDYQQFAQKSQLLLETI